MSASAIDWSIVLGGLNNRELASLALSALALFVILTVRDFRSAAIDILRALCDLKILIVFGSYAAISTVLVAGALRMRIWDLSLLLPTVAWTFTAGMPLAMAATADASRRGWLRQSLKSLVAMSVVFSAITGAHTFTFPAEVVLVLITGAFALIGGGLSAIPNGKAVSKLFLVPVAVVSLLLVGQNLVWMVGNRAALDWPEMTRRFMLPLWLTPPSLLLTLVWSLVFSYEQIWMRLTFSDVERPSRQWKFWLVLRKVPPLPRKLSVFAGAWAFQLGKAESPGSSRVLLHHFNKAMDKRAKATGGKLV